MSILTGQVDVAGYAPGETQESFRRVNIDTLRFVADNARSAARRQLALNEIARRGK
jgi:hypothetical protein